MSTEEKKTEVIPKENIVMAFLKKEITVMNYKISYLTIALALIVILVVVWFFMYGGKVKVYKWANRMFSTSAPGVSGPQTEINTAMKAIVGGC